MSNTYPQELAWQPKTDKPTTVKPLKPLTRKENAFTVELIKNPKQSATQAALKTYNTKSVNTAAQIASDNLRKPHILNELAKHSATAEFTLIEVLEQSKQRMREDKARAVDWATNARQTADSILDRVHGKSTIKVEQHSTTVTLSLSLKDITATTGDSTGQPSQEK